MGLVMGLKWNLNTVLCFPESWKVGVLLGMWLLAHYSTKGNWGWKSNRYCKKNLLLLPIVRFSSWISRYPYCILGVKRISLVTQKISNSYQWLSWGYRSQMDENITLNFLCSTQKFCVRISSITSLELCYITALKLSLAPISINWNKKPKLISWKVCLGRIGREYNKKV